MQPSAPGAAVKHHGDMQEAKGAFLEQFKGAYDSGRWMAVAVEVDPTGRLVVSRTTYAFPVDQFDAALDLLRRDLERDRGGNKPSPLPVRRIPLSPRVVPQEQPQELPHNGVPHARHPVNGEAPDLLPDEHPQQEDDGDLVL